MYPKAGFGRSRVRRGGYGTPHGCGNQPGVLPVSKGIDDCCRPRNLPVSAVDTDLHLKLQFLPTQGIQLPVVSLVSSNDRLASECLSDPVRSRGDEEYQDNGKETKLTKPNDQERSKSRSDLPNQNEQEKSGKCVGYNNPKCFVDKMGAQTVHEVQKKTTKQLHFDRLQARKQSIMSWMNGGSQWSSDKPPLPVIESGDETEVAKPTIKSEASKQSSIEPVIRSKDSQESIYDQDADREEEAKMLKKFMEQGALIEKHFEDFNQTIERLKLLKESLIDPNLK